MVEINAVVHHSAMVEYKQVVMQCKIFRVRWIWRDKSLVAAYLEKSEEALNDDCFSMFGSKAVKKKLRNKKYMLIKWVIFFKRSYCEFCFQFLWVLF